MPRGSLDIGSNSLLLLIQDDQGRTLHDEARVVGLGRGLGDRGMFRPDRMDAAMEVFDAYAQTARQHGLAPWDVRAIATSASRRALNASTFYARVAAETGFRVEVISGEEEARLTWLGARAGLAIPSGPLAVIDLGGGSTEVVIGEEHLIGARVSLEVGSVRLTERFLPPQEGGRVRPQDLYQLRAYVEKTLGSLVVPVAPRTVLAVAGSATTLGAMELGLETWDRERVHGMRLTRAALRRWIDRLLEADAVQRRQLCRVSPERADTLLAGACVLDAVAEHLRKETLRISDGGVRHGVLLEH
jgi:exopolyphosphatase/guanosine-5'-triphosphate,3'-diphosphate pyrophosphatase